MKIRFWVALARAWDVASLYLPVLVMGLLAMGTYWLVRSTPTARPVQTAQAPSHQPDYFLKSFSVKTFDANGLLKSEVKGSLARHFPDTDTLEIDQPRILSIDAQGRSTQALAQMAITNGDGSQVQLMGGAVVERAGFTNAHGQAQPALRFSGEYLHAFLNTERIISHRPVLLTRGRDQFAADKMSFDNLQATLELDGRVRGVIYPHAAP